MDANKITLPDFLIADLFKNYLVEIDASDASFNNLDKEAFTKETLQTRSAVSDKIQYSGENLKNVVIVVKEQNSIHLNEKDFTFLINILKACQLNIADIAIVNAAKQTVSYAAIKEQLNALKILLFDVEPLHISLPFTIPPFQVQNYAGGTIMLAPGLSALNKQTQEGKLLKTKLWNSLKQVFGIG